MHRTAVTLVVGALIVTSATDVSAQTIQDWVDRGYFNFNVGFESTSGTLRDEVQFPIYGESGNTAVEATLDSGGFIDFSVGGRVWQNVSVGIGFHREATTGQATLRGSVPSPIGFTRPRREPVATVDDLKRSERAVHLQFGYMLPLNERISVHVFAGPSFFRLSQEVIGSATYSEQPPAFTTVIATPEVVERSQSRVGANLGADVTYTFYEYDLVKVGGGLFLRYSGTTAGIPVLGSREIESDLGGLQIGFGARVRF